MTTTAIAAATSECGLDVDVDAKSSSGCVALPPVVHLHLADLHTVEMDSTTLCRTSTDADPCYFRAALRMHVRTRCNADCNARTTIAVPRTWAQFEPIFVWLQTNVMHVKPPMCRRSLEADLLFFALPPLAAIEVCFCAPFTAHRQTLDTNWSPSLTAQFKNRLVQEHAATAKLLERVCTMWAAKDWTQVGVRITPTAVDDWRTLAHGGLVVSLHMWDMMVRRAREQYGLLITIHPHGSINDSPNTRLYHVSIHTDGAEMYKHQQASGAASTPA